MRLSLLDGLSCPRCGASPLKINILSEEDVGAVEVESTPVCERYCAVLGGPPSQDSPCAGCLAREILAAELICPRCGSKFGVDEGVPVIPPPAREDFLVGER